MSYNNNKPKYSHMNLSSSFKSNSRHNSGRLLLGRGRRNVKPVKKCYDPKPFNLPSARKSGFPDPLRPLVPPGSSGWGARPPEPAPKPQAKAEDTSTQPAPQPSRGGRAWKTPVAPQPRKQAAASILKSEREKRQETEFPSLPVETADTSDMKKDPSIVTEEVQDLDEFDGEWANSDGGMDFDQPLFFDEEPNNVPGEVSGVSPGAKENRMAQSTELNFPSEAPSAKEGEKSSAQQQPVSSWADDEVGPVSWADNIVPEVPAESPFKPKSVQNPSAKDNTNTPHKSSARPRQPAPPPAVSAWGNLERNGREKKVTQPSDASGILPENKKAAEIQPKPEAVMEAKAPRAPDSKKAQTVATKPSPPDDTDEGTKATEPVEESISQEEMMKKMLEKSRMRFKQRKEAEEREKRERMARIEAKLKALGQSSKPPKSEEAPPVSIRNKPDDFNRFRVMRRPKDSQPSSPKQRKSGQVAN